VCSEQKISIIQSELCEKKFLLALQEFELLCRIIKIMKWDTGFKMGCKYD
jgi:hypothetical protein